MEMIFRLFLILYIYCTDFIINLANLLNLSYYEINFFLFIVIFPLVMIITFSFYMVQKWRLKRLIRGLTL